MNSIKETERQGLTPLVPLSAYEHFRGAVVTSAERGKSMLCWFPRVDELTSCDLAYPGAIGVSLLRSSLENAGSCPRHLF